MLQSVENWLVVGCRRWAKLMVIELCAALPQDARVNIQADPSDPDLINWIAESGLQAKVKIITEPLICKSTQIGVAFVVNSAYLHKSTIENLLAAGYNVVSEKPTSLSQKETKNLFELAKNLNLYLLSVNTYQFSPYLHEFRKTWIQDYSYKRINLSWADPVKETRYGEKKSYDSALPIIYDILPHIANILLVTVGRLSIVSHNVQVMRGGSSVLIHFKSDSIDINVELERNASERKRIIELQNANRNLLFDFTNEPGFVTMNQACTSPLDVSLANMKKPIAAMISSVIDLFELGNLDPRLNTFGSLFGNYLIDIVAESYVSHQSSFFTTSKECSKYINSPQDYKYRMKEIESIKLRALPYLPTDSPLRKLVYST